MAKTKTDPAILSARQNLRQQLKRATQRTFDEQNRLAKENLQWASTRQWRANRKDDRTYEAIVYGVSKLGSAVAASMGVSAPIHISVSDWTKAVTDFKNIQIKVQKDRYDLNDFDQMRRLVSFVKGLIYHEVGHIKFSVPLNKLYGMASPELTENVPLTTRFHRAWNMLEDQRMECAMVRRSEILRFYFQAIVLDHVTRTWRANDIRTNPWPLVAGRTYLPKDLIRRWQAQANQHCVDAGYPTLLADISSVVRRYKKASTADQMWKCIMEFDALMDIWKVVTGADTPPQGGTDHASHGKAGQDRQETERIMQEAASGDPDDADDQDGEQSIPGGSSEEENGEDEGDAQGGASDEEGAESDEQSATEGDEQGDDEVVGSDDGETDTVDPADDAPEQVTQPSAHGAADSTVDEKSIDEMIDEALKDLATDQEIKDFISSVNEEMRSSMQHNIRVRPMGSEEQKGEQVCRGMISTLEVLMDHTEPAWRFRQEDGILDPTAFMTRESGDTDFWINLNDQGKNGFDLAVSVLLDVSTSMASEETDLGIAAYGIRRACDDLGILCTVTTFSDDTQMLWDAQEKVTAVIPQVQCSTNPYDGLMALDDQRYGKGRHLVVILTDGEFNDPINLGRWRGNGRYILAAGIGGQHLLDYLKRSNPDVAVNISGPLDLPNEVAKALIPFII